MVRFLPFYFRWIIYLTKYLPFKNNNKFCLYNSYSCGWGSINSSPLNGQLLYSTNSPTCIALPLAPLQWQISWVCYSPYPWDNFSLNSCPTGMTRFCTKKRCALNPLHKDSRLLAFMNENIYRINFYSHVVVCLNTKLVRAVLTCHFSYHFG